MTILLPTLGVAFAAFCVWLSVRIVNRRERWAKWTLAAVIGLPVLYVLSFGPACWWFAEKVEVEDGYTYHQPSVIYWPIGWAYFQSPNKSRIKSMIRWYATRRSDHVLIPDNNGESSIVVGSEH